ncbi:hypothetical protein ACNKHT_08970 [Shigella flexneri]
MMTQALMNWWRWRSEQGREGVKSSEKPNRLERRQHPLPQHQKASSDSGKTNGAND